MSKKDIKKETEIMEAAAIAEANEKLTVNQNYEQMMKEKQTLIAEASRLTGRVEAFGMIRKLLTVSELLTLKNIKENKVYKNITGCETWVKYCKSIGYSEKHIDEQLENLAILGEEFSETVSDFGLGYRELRKLRASTKSGDVVIKGDNITIEGEVINLSDKDRLRDSLEQLIDSKEEQIRLLNENNKLLTDSVNSKDKLISDANERLEKSYTANDKLKSQIASFKSVELEGIDQADFPAVNMMQECQAQYNKIFLNMMKLVKEQGNSEFVQQMAYALICHIICQTDDIRLELNSRTKKHFEEVRISEELMGKLQEDEDTPIDIIRRKREEINEREKKAKKR